MAKIALLIGVSQYTSSLSPLPAATKDVEAIQQVLEDSEVGGFDHVLPLINPNPILMQREIQRLFSDRKREDLILFFFSGHGIKDDEGSLYFATPETIKTEVQATSVPANFVHQMMSSSRSKRLIVILDCCFSGAFTKGIIPKDGEMVDIRRLLGGEGRAILASSTSTQYSFEQQDAQKGDLSIYTRYLVEGLQSGAADADSDGMVSLDELHEYAERKVREAAPAMSPKFFPFEQGHKILLAKARITDPKLNYRREVERFARRGEISGIGRTTLEILRERLNLTPDETAVIETEVLQPFQQYRQSLQSYEQAFDQAIQKEQVLSDETRDELEHLQQVLGLKDEDIQSIQAKINSQQTASQEDGQQKQLAEWYAQALQHYLNGQWAEAARLLREIVTQQPDYKNQDAAQKLQEAERQQQIAELAAKAEQAYAELTTKAQAYVVQPWNEIITQIEQILRLDPENRNAATRLKGAKRQKQLAECYERARSYYRNRQWQRVIDVISREIWSVDATHPDPENLLPQARERLAEEKQDGEMHQLANLYSQGRRYLEERNWQKAIEKFGEISYVNPHYRDARTLLTTAQQKLANGKGTILSFRLAVLPFVVTLVGWIVAWRIVALKPESNLILEIIASLVGGGINGIAIWIAQGLDLSDSGKQKLLWLFFGSALAGMVIWLFLSVISPNNNNLELIQSLLSAFIGIMVIVILLLWKRRISVS